MHTGYRQDIDALMQKHCAIGQGGLAVGVVQEGVPIYSQGVGILPGRSETVTPQTRFPICSISKTLTATAILQLVEKGDLDLNRPVLSYLDRHLPEGHNLTEDVTLRRLLGHTAGFTRWHAPVSIPPTTDLAGYVRQILPGHPRLAPPGTLHDYSNFGINLAGFVAEVVTGQPFAALLHDLLFAPLGMRQTTFEQCHGPAFPAGGAISTTRDMMHFARMLMDEGRFRGHQLLSPVSLAAMWMPNAKLYLPDGAARGLAFRLDTYKGIRRVGHAGRGGTFGSRLRLAPDAGLSVILLAQGPDTLALDRALTSIEQGLFDVLLDLPTSETEPPCFLENPAQWSRYTGRYVGHEQGLAWIEVAEEALILNWKGRKTALYALQEHLYIGASGGAPAVGFVAASTAAETAPVPYIMLNGHPLARIEDPEDEMNDHTTWESFVGSYQHPSLSSARVFIRAERLCIAFDWLGGSLSCEPLGTRRFACRLGLVEFQEAEGYAPAFMFRTSCIFKRCLYP